MLSCHAVTANLTVIPTLHNFNHGRSTIQLCIIIPQFILSLLLMPQAPCHCIFKHTNWLLMLCGLYYYPAKHSSPTNTVNSTATGTAHVVTIAVQYDASENGWIANSLHYSCLMYVQNILYKSDQKQHSIPHWLSLFSYICKYDHSRRRTVATLRGQSAAWHKMAQCWGFLSLI